MTARTVCPAVYAGLLGGALVATPRSAYALNLQNLTQQSPTGNPFTDGVLWVSTGVFAGCVLGLSILGVKSRLEARKDEEEIVFSEAHHAASHVEKAQYRPRHMKQVNQKDKPDTEHVLHVAKHSNDDVSLEQLADNYVKKETYKKQKSIRSQGVAYVLAQRLGFTTASFMEGIPVIERADGSVGDVGTTWWDEAVEDKRSVAGEFTEYLNIQQDWSAESMLKDPQSEIQPAKKDEVTHNTHAVQTAVEHAVPQVASEHEEFAVDGALAGLAKEDIWKMALAAMDENIDNEVLAHKMQAEEEDDFIIETPLDFEDVIGQEDSLDEPDGLESKTEFIPFKAPAGHPEVVDMDSYLEYLVRSEEERYAAKRFKKKSRKHLRVIEGGTAQFSIANSEYYDRAKEA